jgi:protein-S-isoprenylcysteine O-methyltransferase Ste14
MSVTDQTSDSPGVIAFPPLLYAATLVASLLLQVLVPWHPFSVPLSRFYGGFLLISSAVLAKWGENTLRRAGTNVDPHQPSLVLVTEGPFRFTRNPLYLALVGLYLGITLLLNAFWPWLFLLLLLVITHYGIVRREERYLEAKFGEAAPTGTASGGTCSTGQPPQRAR